MAEDWTATKQANGHWLFTWDMESYADSNIAYDIWLDGELVDTVIGVDEWECMLDGYDAAPPPVEILEDESGVFAENELYPPYAILQWRGTTDASGYQVQRLVGATWQTRDTITERAKGWYYHKTQAMDDDTQETFRVRALDERGNAGSPLSFIFTLARNPAPPDVTLSVDSVGDVQVEEA